MGCDVQHAKESGVKLFGFLPKNEFFKIDYLKWKGEWFSEFFDEETYLVWDKNTGFLNGFRDILLRTLRNRIIIPSNILGGATRSEISQFNIADLIGKQLLDLIDSEIVLWNFINLENFFIYYILYVCIIFDFFVSFFLYILIVIASHILKEEISNFLVQFWCEGEDNPKEEYWQC